MTIGIPTTAAVTVPLPYGYVNNPYQKQQAWALSRLRLESVATEGWYRIGVVNGVEVETKEAPGDSPLLLMVRAKCTVRGVSITQMLSNITAEGARRDWDSGGSKELRLEQYSRRAHKFYRTREGPPVLQSRNVVGTQFIEVNSHLIYVVQCSVPDDARHPATSNNTGGRLVFSGWMLREHDNDTDLIYLIHEHPSGSLPPEEVSKFVEEIPRSLANLVAWTEVNGIVPFVVQTSVGSIVCSETYTHERKSEYALKLVCKGGEQLDIFVDTEVKYKRGYAVMLDGPAKEFAAYLDITIRSI